MIQINPGIIEKQKKKLKNKENELLPCPFCGSTAYIGIESMSIYYSIGCSVCRCNFRREFETKEKAVYFWNKRSK